MELALKNKKALVTGASGGLGRAISYRLACEGADIALHYRNNKEVAEQLLSELPEGDHFLLQADLSETSAADQIKESIAERWNGLNILINNAGVFQAHPINTTADEDWWSVWTRTMNVNLNHVALLTKKLLPLLQTGKSGRIINISSRGAFRGEPEHVAYGASKAGLNAFSQSLAQELAPESIYVYAVAPGFVRTDMTRELLKGKSGKAIRAQSPLNRVGKSSEIAHAVCMLCSESANYMTGAILDVNGASYLRS